MRASVSGAAVRRYTISQIRRRLKWFIAQRTAELACAAAAQAQFARAEAALHCGKPHQLLMQRSCVTVTTVRALLFQDNFSKGNCSKTTSRRSVPRLCSQPGARWFAKRTAMELCSHSENYVFETASRILRATCAP